MIYTSRYSNPELKTGNYTVVGITRGAPKFPLRYTLAGNIMEIAPPGYLFNEYNRERFTPPYFQHMVSKGTAGEADKYDEYMVIDGVLEKMGDWGVDLSGYVQKETGKGLSTNDYTTAEKTKLGGIEEGANKYTHPTHTAAASGLYKVTVDALGHVTATTKVVKNDITGLGIPAQDTTYTEVTQSANGLMTASDKTKLDGMTIATDAEVTEMLTEVFGATA